jgi:hypothetical protein
VRPPTRAHKTQTTNKKEATTPTNFDSGAGRDSAGQQQERATGNRFQFGPLEGSGPWIEVPAIGADVARAPVNRVVVLTGSAWRRRRLLLLLGA